MAPDKAIVPARGGYQTADGGGRGECFRCPW